MNQEIEILLHVVLAAVLSGLIGFERERGDKPAGIRTNMLVGGAVTLLVALGKIIVKDFLDSGLGGYISADPTRVIQAIIVGISFIGAGVVLQIEAKSKIKFLTTAATILFSAGIGISVALHQYILALGITAFILFINYIIGLLARHFHIKKVNGKEENPERK
jgi:putative Mg2+ transporter-C (MgtC) family protein